MKCKYGLDKKKLQTNTHQKPNHQQRGRKSQKTEEGRQKRPQQREKVLI